MDDTKNVPILQESDKKFPAYEGSQKEKEVVAAVFQKFSQAVNERNQPLNNFDGLTLIEYIEDSYRRYTTNVDIRDDIEDWQATVHDPFTRNKVNAMLGKVVAVLPVAEFHGRGDEDIRKGQITTNLYEYSEEIDDYEEFLITLLNEAIVKGTAIGYEGHQKSQKKVRYIDGSGDQIKIKEDIRKENKLTAEVVRLEDFYPSSLGVRRLRDLPYCFWRYTLPYQQFLQDYASYSKADKVQPYNATYRDLENKPYYLDFISNNVQEGSVEVIRYYNKDVDEYIIVANGIWLNPIVIDGKEEVSPLPFNHKELPFFDIKFELFESSFFYGKSLPDKLKNLQDVLNVLTNMLLDQSFLTIFPPMLTAGLDSIEDDYLRPGRRTPVDTNGLSLQESFMKLDLGTPSGWHQYILEYTRKIMEESSVDRVSQGIAGAGDRTTAQEIRVAAEGVSSMLGLFGRWVKSGVKRKAMLRAKNILQFWTDENSPVIEQILGEGGAKDMSKAFNIFKINNTTLSDGKRGTKIIEMFAKKDDMPTQAELSARADVFELETDKKIEIIAIPSSYLRDFDFDIKLVVNQKSEKTQEAEKALMLEKVRVYLSFFPDMVNKEELLAQLAEKMGDDPTKIIKENLFPGFADEGAMKSMVDNGMSTLPQGNAANNAARGMRGGEQGANDLQALQAQMVG